MRSSSFRGGLLEFVVGVGLKWGGGGGGRGGLFVLGLRMG